MSAEISEMEIVFHISLLAELGKSFLSFPLLGENNVARVWWYFLIKCSQCDNAQIKVFHLKTRFISWGKSDGI